MSCQEEIFWFQVLGGEVAHQTELPKGAQAMENRWYEDAFSNQMIYQNGRMYCEETHWTLECSECWQSTVSRYVYENASGKDFHLCQQGLFKIFIKTHLHVLGAGEVVGRTK